jgi:Putative zinc-finger
MSCQFAHDDAAYVLGALAPAERLEFEKHLATCGECTRAVQELAGLPGLLGRVDARVLEQPPADEPVPDTLLPALSREVVRARRRRTFAAAGLAAAVVAVVAVGAPIVANQIDDGDGRSPSASAPSAEPIDIVTRPMSPVGEVPVEATLGLEQVKWGTKLLLTCSYEPQSVKYNLPPSVDYTLFVRTRGGTTEQVGSWRSIGGTTMHLAAATSSNRGDIESVEVRTPSGRVVLRLGA